ncbi:hypothetical protein [Streptomyces rugosispiralis]|uniref:Uncharacterized protein n=1 Tax=Streptomyces rugosispiralis TaxID=2967341 RepID=A0ABT1V2L4_9ACTN|nr:hypothetical protein [Streptomyces rugosispiralis]MCQ8191630.1 hypothetical protein [Streptomyces rugosispiralis]
MDEREMQRAGYPLTIPDVLLRSEAMQRACATRNFREIFRLINMGRIAKVNRHGSHQR